MKIKRKKKKSKPLGFMIFLKKDEDKKKKEIRSLRPPNTGTLFHNYKGLSSIVLLAICDAKYQFTLVGTGQYGSNNDCGVLANSTVGGKFSNGTMNIPLPSSLVGCSLHPLLIS